MKSTIFYSEVPDNLKMYHASLRKPYNPIPSISAAALMSIPLLPGISNLEMYTELCLYTWRKLAAFLFFALLFYLLPVLTAKWICRRKEEKLLRQMETYAENDCRISFGRQALYITYKISGTFVKVFYEELEQILEEEQQFTIIWKEGKVILQKRFLSLEECIWMQRQSIQNCNKKYKKTGVMKKAVTLEVQGDIKNRKEMFQRIREWKQEPGSNPLAIMIERLRCKKGVSRWARDLAFTVGGVITVFLCHNTTYGVVVLLFLLLIWLSYFPELFIDSGVFLVVLFFGGLMKKSAIRSEKLYVTADGIWTSESLQDPHSRQPDRITETERFIQFGNSLTIGKERHKEKIAQIRAIGKSAVRGGFQYFVIPERTKRWRYVLLGVACVGLLFAANQKFLPVWYEVPQIQKLFGDEWDQHVDWIGKIQEWKYKKEQEWNDALEKENASQIQEEPLPAEEEPTPPARFSNRVTLGAAEQEYFRNPAADICTYYTTDAVTKTNHFQIRDGVLYGYGVNDTGILGQGNYESYLGANGQYHEQEIAKGVRHTALGEKFMVYLDQKSRLYGTGMIPGNGETTVLWPELIAEDVTYASCSNEGLIFLKKDGTAWAVGQLCSPTGEVIVSYEQLTKLGENVSYVKASGEQMAMIGEDGKLWLWGDNSTGQCGISSQEQTSISQPTVIAEGCKGVWFDHLQFSSDIWYLAEEDIRKVTYIQFQNGVVEAFGAGIEDGVWNLVVFE